MGKYLVNVNGPLGTHKAAIITEILEAEGFQVEEFHSPAECLTELLAKRISAANPSALSHMMALPPELLAALEEAAISLDTNMSVTVVANISAHNRIVAGILRELAGHFRYDEIVTLIQKTKST